MCTVQLSVKWKWKKFSSICTEQMIHLLVIHWALCWWHKRGTIDSRCRCQRSNLHLDSWMYFEFRRRKILLHLEVHKLLACASEMRWAKFCQLNWVARRTLGRLTLLLTAAASQMTWVQRRTQRRARTVRRVILETKKKLELGSAELISAKIRSSRQMPVVFISKKWKKKEGLWGELRMSPLVHLTLFGRVFNGGSSF